MKNLLLLILLSAAAWAGPAEDLKSYLTGITTAASEGHYQDYFEQHTGIFSKDALQHARDNPGGLLVDSAVGYRSFQMGKKSIAADRATIAVKFHIRMEIWRTSQFKMRNVDGHWVIEDILYSNGTSLLKP